MPGYFFGWLTLLAILCCFSLANTQEGRTNTAVQRLLSSRKVKDALYGIFQSLDMDKYIHFLQTNMSSLKNSTSAVLGSQLKHYVDAAGKPPSAISLGNLAWLGSFDSCQDIPYSHYCLLHFNVNLPPGSLTGEQTTSAFFPLKWGSCFPNSYKASDINRTVEYLLHLVAPEVKSENITIEYQFAFCPEKAKYTNDVIVTLVFCGVLLLLCLLGTGIDVFRGESDGPSKVQHKKKACIQVTSSSLPLDTSDPSALSYFQNFNDHTTDMSAHLTPEMVETKAQKMRHVTGACLKFLLCFSLLRNTNKIFNTQVSLSAITSVNGVRVISMFWIILGHTFLFLFFSSLAQNPVDLINDTSKLSMMVIINGYFSVDSFFFLSGLLLAYTVCRKMEKSEGKFNWITFYLHRYFRLTPTLMFVILFFVKLRPLLVYSPAWDVRHDACNKYWWTNLIYINNFFPTKFSDECISWTWYLANDMQFFVITPPLLVLTYRFGWRGLLASAGSLLLVSTIVTASLIGYYNLDPIALGKFHDLHVFTQNAFENKIYDKPYARIQPYLVGFFLGYFMHNSYSGTRKPGWILAIVCWLVAFALGMTLVYAPHNTTLASGRKWTKAENVIYGTLERPLWGLALAWVVYACHYGYGGLIQKFLSAKFWIPLSRLTYSAYLLHPIILEYMFYGSKSTILYSFTTLSYYYLAALVLSYGAAFILALVIEFPCDNLENLALKSAQKTT